MLVSPPPEAYALMAAAALMMTCSEAPPLRLLPLSNLAVTVSFGGSLVIGAPFFMAYTENGSVSVGGEATATVMLPLSNSLISVETCPPPVAFGAVTGAGTPHWTEVLSRRLRCLAGFMSQPRP